jgi:hypothetical protein
MDQTLSESELQSVGSNTNMQRLGSMNNVTVDSDDSNDQILSTNKRQKSFNDNDVKPLIKKNLKDSDIIKK